MSWAIIPEFRLPDEPEALTYIAAVEAADGQALEPAVKLAINAFIKGCKADGIWPAIKASCILAGARTLTGALVPLVGTAPTNFNFVSGDYNRKTGLVGNASTKYLNSNRANNADPQNSNHNAFYQTTAGGGQIFSGAVVTGGNTIFNNGAGSYNVRQRALTVVTSIGTVSAGMVGTSRSSSESFTFRASGLSSTQTLTSQTPSSENLIVFGLVSVGVPTANTNARLAFYSIGESLNLTLLDARVTTLINAFDAAI